MTSPATTSALEPVSAEVFHDLQRFYARQMYLLDEHRVTEWLDTFAPDGTFASNGLPEPAAGRAAVERLTTAGVQDRERRGAVHRHLVSGLYAEESLADGIVLARSYVLVVETLRDQRSEVWASTVCQDRLRRHGDTWRILHRQVCLDRKGHADAVLGTR